MKVLIVAPSSLRYCPYVFFYVNMLREESIDYEVVFPDKANLNDHYDFPTHIYNWNSNQNRFLEMINYRQFVLNLIKDNKYHFYIVLTTGLAVLLCSSLRKMGLEYLLDIRDYTHENNRVYYQIEKKAIDYSTGCVISSPKFRMFLPKHDYWDVFNTQSDLELQSDQFVKNDNHNPIHVSYVGTIAYIEQCEKFIKLVENDSRFRFDLYGNFPFESRISQILKENKLKHTEYHGPYTPYEKSGIIQKSDILFNAYGNDSPLLLYALSNKLTDAALFYKPVLNSPGTSMHDILGPCSFPIDLSSAKNLNELYEWYKELDNDIVTNQMNEIRKTILQTNDSTKKKVLNCIRK